MNMKLYPRTAKRRQLAAPPGGGRSVGEFTRVLVRCIAGFAAAASLVAPALVPAIARQFYRRSDHKTLTGLRPSPTRRAFGRRCRGAPAGRGETVTGKPGPVYEPVGLTGRPNDRSPS